MNSKRSQKNIHVYADWVGLKGPILVGMLTANYVRGKEVFAFEYTNDWLSSESRCSLDPSLSLYSGLQYPSDGKNNFGIFLDSCPDRWGRFLMKRREVQAARDENRESRILLESDYLLGVYDAHRVGGLRFKLDHEGPFLDDNKNYAAPPWASLRELAHASEEIEKPGSEENLNYQKWLSMLIQPGGSLGGARPKAGVLDEKKHPWIAKFPSSHDDYDVGAWEMLTYKLAQLAKITMSESAIKKFRGRYHTFLSKRFDRNDQGRRIHFASAMTLLQRHDGDDASSGVSYLDLAELIIQHGAQTDMDLEALWRRIVFSICISNTDDHLRNHGFLFLPPRGWVLSPAYDINPNPNGDGLKLNISEEDNSQDLDLARSVAQSFRINSKRSNQIIIDVVGAVKNWRKQATEMGISKSEQEAMSRAFRVAEVA